MLRVVQNQSSGSAKSYYSHAEYYGEGQELAGVWHGKLAGELGLSGEIRQCDFDAMCDNLHPQTKQPLTARNDKNRTVGYDFNFHAPKGVSLAFAMGDKRIVDVFDQAVTETMEDIERDAKTRVRVGGRNEDRLTSNLAWGQFIHTTARPVDGEPDPHLHAHCFTFNATKDPIENRIKAAQFRELKRDAGYYEARLHARLAKAVREQLGYDIERNGRHWDITIPDDIKQKFSRRTALINAKAEAEGVKSPDGKGELGAVTREKKVKDLTFRELQDCWRERLTPQELESIAAAMRTGRDSGAIVNGGPETTADSVGLAIAHCFEREAVVPTRTLHEEALRVGVGMIDVDAVELEMNQQRVLTRDLNGRNLATTPDVLRDEQDVIDYVRHGKHSAQPLNPSWQIRHDWMSDEQKHAVKELVNSRSNFQLILGGAGTGKTTLMTEAVAAIEDGGHQVFTFAPSAEASRGVLRSEGFESATTVAELLVNEKLQDSIAGQVIWVDEAGLLGSRQLKRLCNLAEHKDARVILSGDWKRQHGSVDRGGVLGLLDRYAGVAPIQIDTIRRQQGRYKEAIQSIAEGNILRGFDQLDDLGWIYELDDDERDKQLAKDFADSVEKNRSALVVSPTHREAQHLTAAIRTELRDRELIDGENHDVLSLKPLHLTEAERSNPAFLEKGDVIVFHQNARGYTKGDRIEIGDAPLPDELTKQAARYSVFRKDVVTLAAGDKVRITAGGTTKDGEHRLNNGATFDVKGIHDNGDIEFKNGWVVDSQYGFVTNGFVTTSHSSQGRTVQDVFISESAESFGAASRQQFYVSASRGKASARIYTDRKDELRDVIRASAENVTASELFWPMDQQELHKKQQLAATREHGDKEKEPELVHAR
ncbi:MAG: relaxase domain-containing protein [Planctomycetales bacterium]|nr:relaxase domain-containing protein [Planctomycetales bacterium]